MVHVARRTPPPCPYGPAKCAILRPMALPAVLARTAIAIGLLQGFEGRVCSAQNPPRVERGAPRSTLSLQLAWASVGLDYGRPAVRGRAIFGQLVPWDRLWRLGADEATRLSNSADLELGTLRVPAGDYALFAIPHVHTWTLIVNSVAQQWGAWNANPANDIGRVELVVETLDTPVETLTMTLEASADQEKEGTLRIAWERSQVSVPLRILGEPPLPPPLPGAAKGSGTTPEKPGGSPKPGPVNRPPPR